MDVIERMSVVIGSNVSSDVAELSADACPHMLSADLSAWLMVCPAGSSDEGRRGGRDPGQVLHAELFR